MFRFSNGSYKKVCKTEVAERNIEQNLKSQDIPETSQTALVQRPSCSSSAAELAARTVTP